MIEVMFNYKTTAVFLKSLAFSFALVIGYSVKATAAGTDINWNEVKTGSGPIVFLVNGFGGCDPCITRDLHAKLKNSQIAVYDFDWNDIHRRTQQNHLKLSDTEFLSQMNFVLESVPKSRPIILIGHSFGGDSVLKVAQRTSRKISLLGVLDAVEFGGVRTRRSVRSNVQLFYNRWTKNPSNLFVGPGIPLNPKSTGSLNCDAQICKQEEQSFGYNADGSAHRVDCESFEITCPGYNPAPVALGGSNGTKHRRITHGGGVTAIYKDQYIQESLFQAIIQIRDVPPIPELRPGRNPKFPEVE
jgi:hypothetical protein